MYNNILRLQIHFYTKSPFGIMFSELRYWTCLYKTKFLKTQNRISARVSIEIMLGKRNANTDNIILR